MLEYFHAHSNLLIIWYDSMTSTGAINYQNALDAQNQMFFQDGSTLVSDDMFLNFDWTASGPRELVCARDEHSAAVRTSSTPASTCNRTAITRRELERGVPGRIAARDVNRFLPARVDVHLIDEPRRFLCARQQVLGRAERRSEQYHDDRRLEGRRELHSGQLADHDGAVRDELQHRTGQPIRDRGRHRLERAMEQSKPARRAADVALDHEQRRFAAHAGARFRAIRSMAARRCRSRARSTRSTTLCSTRRIFRSMRTHMPKSSTSFRPRVRAICNWLMRSMTRHRRSSMRI